MVNKKGDMFDLILLQQKLYEDHLEPSAISDYPETVIEILRAFYKIWMLPEGSIPSKKQKSKYKEWVLQLTQLSSLFNNDEQMREAMKIAFNKYEKMLNKFSIYRPIVIKNLLIDAVSEMNRKRDKIKKEEEEKRKDVVKPDRFRRLKKENQ